VTAVAPDTTANFSEPSGHAFMGVTWSASAVPTTPWPAGMSPFLKAKPTQNGAALAAAVLVSVNAIKPAGAGADGAGAGAGAGGVGAGDGADEMGVGAGAGAAGSPDAASEVLPHAASVNPLNATPNCRN
jgi:hypothetical protein